MKQFTLLAAFMLLQFHALQAQNGPKYLGARLEIGSILSNSSEAATVNKPLSIGLGMSYTYLYSSTWEMTVNGIASFYKLSGDTREFDSSTKKWTATGVSRGISVVNFDIDYTLLHGFGDDQRIKVGIGGWFGLFGGSKPTLNTNTESWGTDAALEKNYQLLGLYNGGTYNYGGLVEGIYNVNDALQFSLRFKLGLANLYNTDSAFLSSSTQSTATWKTNAISLGALYYFGAEERGSKKSSKGKAKKKVNF
jgi:hypothetical protein